MINQLLGGMIQPDTTRSDCYHPTVDYSPITPPSYSVLFLLRSSELADESDSCYSTWRDVDEFSQLVVTRIIVERPQNEPVRVIT